MKSQLKNFRRFRQELAYCHNKVPFYGKKLRAMNLEPENIHRLSQLHQLPLTSKKDYRKHFPMGVLAKGYTLNQKNLTRSQSSGTTGERVTTFELGVLLYQRAQHCSSVHPIIEQVFTKQGRKICRYAAPNCSDVECANPHSTMRDRMLPDGTLVLPVYHDLLTTSQELIERAIEEILTYKPDLYYIDPTHFAFLLRECKKRGVTLPQAPVISSYSMASKVSKRQIGEFIPLDSHFSELLSSSEMGWVAMSCSQGHLHLNEGAFLFEFIRDGQSVKPGELGEMCISSLDQGAIPHLRYQTGDWFQVVAGRCPCEHPSTRVITEGRATQLTTGEDSAKTISPRAIDNAIGAPVWLDQYQLSKRGDRNYLLQVICNQSYSSDSENQLIDALLPRLPENANLTCECVNYIPCDRSGKFQIIQLNQHENEG